MSDTSHTSEIKRPTIDWGKMGANAMMTLPVVFYGIDRWEFETVAILYLLLILLVVVDEDA